MSQKINSAIFTAFVYCLSCTLVFAQTAALLPNALQQYFTNDGNPLSSGTVGFYFPSTFNLKPIWQDSGEATPWTNPLTLDAGGKPPGGSGGIYGQGTYRQIVKDASGNTIWDAVTSSAGTGATFAGTGDGDLVGTVKPWAGIQPPNQYMFSYGEQISRITYSVLFTAITQTLNVVCASSSNTLTGISDTTSINVGSPVELSCVPPGTTVSSKTTSTVVMSNPSSVSLNTTAMFFPFGNGDGSTTFTLPDFRAVVIAGRPNMGGIASSFLTNCTNAAQGTLCGNQNQTLTRANLPNVVLPFAGTPQTWSLTANALNIPLTNSLVSSIQTGGGGVNQVPFGATLTNTNQLNVSVTPAGTIQSINGNVTQTSFSTLQPTITLNYIIKVLPDVSSAIATGVTSIGGMTGSIACGTGLTCTGNVITAAGGTGTPIGPPNAVQFNNSGSFGGTANLIWNNPTLSIGSVGTAGQLSIFGSTSGNVTQTVQTNAGTPTITWGNANGTPAVTANAPLSITGATGNISCGTCGITTNPLSQFAATTSAQLAGVLSDETGTGLAVFNSSPTLITPTIGAATATSINGLAITASTGTLTIANGKTLTNNNSLTLAGTDATTITFQGTDTYVGRATTDTFTNKTYDTAGTGNSFKINGNSITGIGGNTATVGTVSGVLTTGHCVSIDANANLVDAGGACTTGGGGGTVNSGVSGQIAYYGTSSTIVSGNANATISAGALTLGIGGSVQGSLKVAGVTSGTTTFAVAAAASGTLTFPSATDTIVGRTTTDTLTNKTINSAANTLTLDTATGTFKIAGTSITSISGNTAKVATTSGTLNNNDCVSIDASGNLIDSGGICGTKLAQPGFVTVYNNGSAWVAQKEDGTFVSTGSTTTCAVQEALTYAYAKGLSVAWYGKGTSVVCNTTTTITIPADYHDSLYCYGVYANLITGAGASNGFIVDTQRSNAIKCDGAQWNYEGTASAWQIQPSHAPGGAACTAGDTNCWSIDSDIEIGTIFMATASSNACFQIDITQGNGVNQLRSSAFVNNRSVKFNCEAQGNANYGLQYLSPVNTFQVGGENEFIFGNIEGFTTSGISIGTTSSNDPQLGTNHYTGNIAITGNTVSERGIDENAIGDVFDLTSLNCYQSIGSQTNINWHGNALNNTIRTGQILACGGGLEGGTTQTFVMNNYLNGAWRAFTPSLTCAGGTVNASTALGRAVQSSNPLGKTVNYELDLTLTTLTGCTTGVGGAITATVPWTPKSNAVSVGHEATAAGTMYQGLSNAGGSTITVTRYDNTCPACVSGGRIVLSGSLEQQ